MKIGDCFIAVLVFLLMACGSKEKGLPKDEEANSVLNQLSDEAKAMQLRADKRDSLNAAMLLQANEIVIAEEAREEAEEQAALECGCEAKTFGVKTKHSWVEFRLPQRAKEQVIKIRKGSYNRFVFPKNYRVFWSDILFRCEPNTCRWQRVSGNWGRDNTLEVTPLTNGPYAFTGDRN